MKDVRATIRAVLAAKDLSMKEVSEKLGKNHAYIDQFLRLNKPVHLPEQVRHKLAQILGMHESELRDFEAQPQVAASHGNGLKIPEISLTTIQELPRNLPVLGVAIAGDPQGGISFNGAVIEMVRRPPRLQSVLEAYALYVSGSSMAPWREDGQLVYVHPMLPVRPGDYVVVQLKPLEEGDAPIAYIKRLVRRTEKEIRLKQFNPDKEVTFPATKVQSVHRIVEWTDLLGF